MKKFDYDIIVIGSGSGGLTASIGLAGAGKKVALIEKGLIGGDCTNFGCVPSKALIDVAKSGKYTDLKGALEEVRNRRKEIQDEETVEKIEKHGMKIFKGIARFKDKNTILIDGKKEVTAKNIIISTGSHPIIYPIDGLDKKDLLTNESVFELKDNIKSLVVIGGGYIGCELAESFANLGVKVTIIQRNSKLIPREEQESSEVIENIFREKAINIMTSTTVEKAEGKKIIIFDRDTKTKKEIEFDKVLVALGRGANIDNLGLDNTKIKYNKNGIIVDKYNRTKEKNIFAIGDCVSGNPQFTHLANNEARGVIRNLLVPFFYSSLRNAILPATLYTNIEVARVGKTREELLEHYNLEDIVSKIIYFENNDRSKLTLDKIGFVKINFRRVSGKIMGATVVGSNAGEILPVLTSAMENKISAYKLSKLIFAYPTKAEIIKKVADSFVVGTVSNIKGEFKYFLKDNILQIITAIIWIIILYTFFMYKNMHDLGIEEIAFMIYKFIKENPAIGPFIYILMYAFRPLVLFPATIMTFMSGALFGYWGGFIYTMIGENISASFSYFLGRIFGKKIIKPEANNGIIDDLRNKANESPFITILMARLLFFPFDIVNYISGFLKINYKGYALATIVGIIPGASVFILAGAAFYTEEITSFSDTIKKIDVTMLYMAAGLFIITFLLAKLLKKFRK